MAEAKQFSDAPFFAPENAGKYGEEVAGCRTLTFVDEHTFEMLTPCCPKGAIFPHEGHSCCTRVIGDKASFTAFGRPATNGAKPNHWLGTFDRVEWARPDPNAYLSDLKRALRWPG